VFPDGKTVLASSAWNDNNFGDFNEFSSLSSSEKSECFSRTLSACNTLIECVNDDLDTVDTTISNVLRSKTSLPDADKRCTLIAAEETEIVVQEQMVLASGNPDLPFAASSTDSIHRSASTACSTQTDDNADDVRELHSENEGLRAQVHDLQGKYHNLKETYDSAVEEFNRAPSRTHSEGGHSEVGHTSLASMSTDMDITTEDLHNQLEIANRSYEELSQRVVAETATQQCKQTQLGNLVATLFVLMVLFGALVMLGIVRISPGSLPMLSEESTWTWSDVWEQLF
jgi:hypothetical protein